jgi:branched-chain amino acid transport system substrate-binding protein
MTLLTRGEREDFHQSSLMKPGGKQMSRLNALLVFCLVILSGMATAAKADPIKCGLSNGKDATGEPINIGSIVSKTGPDDFSASASAAQAYFQCVNHNGGIGGRPINYIVGDDQWNPEVATQLRAKMVDDQKVVAMVGSSSFVECAANAKSYEASGIIVVAGVGVPRECFTSKNYAPLNAGPRLSTIAAAQYLNEKNGAKSFVCISLNIPNFGTWVCDGINVWAKANGLKSDTILIDPGSADATSTILQAAALKPDAIVFCLSKNTILSLLSAADQQGLSDKIKFGSGAAAYSRELPGVIGPSWNGKFVTNMEFQAIDSTDADNQNWIAIMDKYAAPNVSRDTFSQGGYLAARLVTETLLKLDPAKISREAVATALRGVDNFQSDILCSAWYYGAEAARHNADNTLRNAIVDGKSWKVVSPCTKVVDPELADIREYEQKVRR